MESSTETTLDSAATAVGGPPATTVPVAPAVNPEKIIASPRFPTLPAVAMRIIELLSEPDVGVREVGALIKTDPALTMMMLKTANSPLYSPRREITSIESALALLGQNTVMTLALGFTLVDTAKQSDTGPIWRAYWLRSVAQAAAAETLGSRYKKRHCSELFLCGLLCDVGRMGCLRVIPEQYDQVIQRQHQQESAAVPEAWQTLTEIERELLGFDHADLGHKILVKWGLPKLICEAVRCHHASHDDQGDLADVPNGEIVQSIVVASAVADYFMCPTVAPYAQSARQLGQEHFGLSDEDWNEYLNDVHQRTQQIGEMLDIETSELLDPVDIIAMANSQLVELTVRSQALAAEAWTRCDSMRKSHDDLENENLTLKQRIVRDGLTQVYNRSFFEEFVDKELERCRRTNGAIASIFCDIDKFKSLNDTYGHAFGDEVLRQVAAAIQSAVRASDIVARYGGEEFVVLVVNADPASLREIAERVRHSVEELDIRFGETRVRMSISVGVSSLLGAGHNANADALIAAADIAMYQAKRTGGNRVHFSEPA